MCGIAGVVRLDQPVERRLLEQMIDSMEHRGPDDRGSWLSSSRRTGFGHCRLSILDLSKASAQPMRGSRDEVVVSFNGEIYNFSDLRVELSKLGHRFTTTGDTEIVLNGYLQWGREVVQKLDGMFALSIHDERAGGILLARDRAGEKPLFYRVDQKELRFASELKALLLDPAIPRRMSLEAVDEYLTYGYVARDRCIVDSVRKLAPAHALWFSTENGRHEIWSYWEIPSPSESRLPDIELEHRFEEVLAGAVQRQLVADVPVGILLSGGVDSSLIAALAVKGGRPVRTFTITFPGHATHDEGPHARLVAEFLGTHHRELPAPEASMDLVPMLARQYDEPIADSSMVPTYLVSKAIREHATVALGGDGGDELFGGYFHYNWICRQQKLTGRLPAAATRLVAAAGRRLPPGTRGRNFIIGLGGNAPFSHVNLVFDQQWRERIFPALRDGGLGALAEKRRVEAVIPAGSVVRQAMALDFRTYLPDDLLVKVDRASMLTSLEVRAPFLDRTMLEFAFRDVPDSMKADGTHLKILPKRVAARLLPREFDLKRKQGFSLPLKSWFRGSWGNFVRDTLRESPYYHWPAVESLIRGEMRGRNNSHRLYSLVFFELWRREYGMTL